MSHLSQFHRWYQSGLFFEMSDQITFTKQLVKGATFLVYKKSVTKRIIKNHEKPI